MSTPTKSPASSVAQIFEFQITLHYVDPPIWRRFQVRDDTTLGTLHEIVQVVMGWEESHLHEFEWGSTHYGPAEPEMGLETKDEEKAKLAKLKMKSGDVLRYVYDFGDYWQHDLKLEAILPPDPGVKYPICLEGERACPPEDCGSVEGYENIVRILALPPKKRSDEDLEMLDWLGDEYDPEEFDIDAVNAQLAQFSRPRWGWVPA